MITGTTKTGFKYEIPDKALDDYELIELLNEYESGKEHLITKVIDQLLGKEQKDKLKEHVRVDGKVSAEKMMNEVVDILNGSSEVKN